MATTARIARVLIIATSILALSVTAAQARPTGLGYAPARTAAARGYDTTFNRTSAAQQTVTAVQARPASLGYAPARTYAARGYDITFNRSSAARQTSSVMSPAVDPANAQQVPIVVPQAAAPVKVIDSGFSWTAGLLGAGVASLVLLLAAITASRIRPRRVAHL